MAVKNIIRAVLPIAALPFLSLVSAHAARAAPGPYAQGPNAGAYVFRLPMEIPMGPRRTVQTELQVNELTFAVPVAQFGGKKGPKLSVGGVAGRAKLDGFDDYTDFGKLIATLHGIGLGRGINAAAGVRGKGYRDSDGKRNAGLDLGVRAGWKKPGERNNRLEVESDLFDWLRRGEDRKWKFKVSGEIPGRIKGLDLPDGISIEGAYSTDSMDPSLAVSKAFVLMGAKGGQGAPRVVVVPAVGEGLISKTPFVAAAVKIGRLMMVGVKEPYRGETKTTVGTHVIVSFDLDKLHFGKAGTPPSQTELLEQESRFGGIRQRASFKSRETARMRR